VIELHSVNKTYGEGASRVEAVREVDLCVAAGEFVSIMGPSGSGKSTLLNLVSALEKPTAGRIVIDGQDVATLDDDALTLFRRRRIGLVFQFFHLLPTLDALDNVLLPVMLERKATSADREQASRLLDEVGLGARAAHRIHQLSGGELQRVAIARALLRQPPLILADEPTGNLDSATGAAILELLGRACRSRGTTVVMVTHDDKAARAGDRIVLMKDGQVSGEEVVASPRRGSRALGALP
jgi:putative ABC transport system ATP-binding protein